MGNGLCINLTEAPALYQTESGMLTCWHSSECKLSRVSFPCFGPLQQTEHILTNKRNLLGLPDNVALTFVLP